MKYYSFDVFDTTLVRLTGSPHSLFTLLGFLVSQKHPLGFSPVEFRAKRIAAEEAVYARHKRQPTLAEIYDELRKNSGWTSEIALRVQTEEMELEKNLIRPVKPLLRIIDDARKEPGNIVFVSDMYLPQEIVEAMLRDHGALRPQDRCYVSSRFSKTKAEGTLFSLVNEDIGANPKVHYGDNPHSDGLAARNAGFESILVTDTGLNRFERILESGSDATSGFSSLLAGVSRKTRLDLGLPDPVLNEVINVASGVAAPLLVSYVQWCLQRAKEQKLEKLFFTSRDGQILHEIAKVLAPQSGFEGELGYFYGGRQAWVFPCLESLNQETFDSFLAIYDAIPDLGIFEACGIDEKIIAEHFGEETLSSLRDSKNDGWERYDAFRKVICHPEIAKRFELRAKEQRVLLLEYLSAFGLSKKSQWGFVETGWKGTLQRALYSLLEKSDVAQPVGFYLGLSARPALAQPELQKCFLYDENSGVGPVEMKKFISTPVEMFCAADHAPVVGYERDSQSGKVQPRLAFQGLPENAPWMETFRGAVLAYAKTTTELAAFAPLFSNGDHSPYLSRLVSEFWLSPTREEASAFSTFHFESGALGKQNRSLAEKYGVIDLISAMKRGDWKKKGNSFWVGGALALSPNVFSRSMRLRSKLRDGYRRLKK